MIIKETKRIKAKMNYWFAFVGCLAFTLIILANDFNNWHWYVQTNLNVGVWLLIAWLLDER